MQADELAKKTLEEFATALKDYTSANGVDEKRKELNAQIQETHARLLNKNTALMAAFCYDPLQEAYRELRMQVKSPSLYFYVVLVCGSLHRGTVLQECEMNYQNMWLTRTWWSRKCLWPGPRYTFGFKYAAFKTAQKHLDRAQAEPRKGGNEVGVVLSQATRTKVIQSWVEHDLARFSTIVFFNFSLLSAIVVILLTSVSWLFGRLGLSNRNDSKDDHTPGSSPLERSPYKKDHSPYKKREGAGAFVPRGSPNYYHLES